jgi:hypothetical protein
MLVRIGGEKKSIYVLIAPKSPEGDLLIIQYLENPL